MTNMPSSAAKIVFVTRLSESKISSGLAYSAAAQQVQKKILEELIVQYGSDNVECISVRPAQAWPKGIFYFSEVKIGPILYTHAMNLPIFRGLFSFFVLFTLLLKNTRKIQIFYNAYLSDVFVVLLQKLLGIDTKSCIIIQDIRLDGQNFTFRARIHDYLAMRFAKYFDLCVPISQQIVNDFGLDKERCIIFKGGITDIGENLLPSLNSLERIAVFAGALEPYNGSLNLVNQWIQQGIEFPLHIFGKGSEEIAIRSLAGISECVFFHGFEPENEIIKWQKVALVNVCLRFGIGLNQKYFFPSKFFNIACAPGYVLVNNFFGIPEQVVNYLVVVDDNLSSLKSCLNELIEDYESTNGVRNDIRRKLIVEQFTWKSCVNAIASHLCKE